MANPITDKQAIQEWNEYVENIRKLTAVTGGESDAEQKERMIRLEKTGNEEEWFKYYFPNYCYSPFAPFHTQATRDVMDNPEWLEVRNWARELAKDVITMMQMLYLTLTGKKRYMLMVSNSWDAAESFLRPYKANLEGNARIIRDYGIQELPGSWSAGDFTTRSGVKFMAVGAGQSPRGTRNEQYRPDVILFNDIDTDEECMNADIIEKKWRWIENAAIGTRSVSMPTLIIFIGNIIAEDCCVVRAQAIADKVSIVNIRDENGNSTWPGKNTEEMIDRVLSQKSYSSAQQEYFNNPVYEGKIFKKMNYGKCPRLEEFPFILFYGDPSTSNNDKPGIHSKSKNSTKALVALGYLNGVYYILKAWVESTTNYNFIRWMYDARKMVLGKVPYYFCIENNSLQDPFYQQVFRPLVAQVAQDYQETVLELSPDETKKGDKFFRIEGTLEPLHRNNQLILNIEEKDNVYMKALETQFKSVSPKSKTMDAPDATQGGVFIIQTKIGTMKEGSIKSFPKYQNQRKRW